MSEMEQGDKQGVKELFLNQATSVNVAIGGGSPGEWKQYTNPVTGRKSTFMLVDTSRAGFRYAPDYSVDLINAPVHTVTDITHPTANSFRIDVRRPGYDLTTDEAISRGSTVRWLGTAFSTNNYLNPVVTGSGRTDPTRWQQYGTSGIFVDVDTTTAYFPRTPNYVCSLYGNAQHWDTTGGSSIYDPKPTGFRVYVRYTDGRQLTPQIAQDLGWYIGWIGQYIEPEQIG